VGGLKFTVMKPSPLRQKKTVLLKEISGLGDRQQPVNGRQHNAKYPACEKRTKTCSPRKNDRRSQDCTRRKEYERHQVAGEPVAYKRW